jgi:hypothetical protein
VDENLPVSEVVEAEGHLIDSQLLGSVFDGVVKHRGSFDVLAFDIGRTNEEPSRIRMRVTAPGARALQSLLEELLALGCRVSAEHDVSVQAADRDGCARRSSSRRAERSAGSSGTCAPAIGWCAGSMAFVSSQSSASGTATASRS